MDLILKKHEEIFTKNLCDTLKPTSGQLTEIQKEMCETQRKTLDTLGAEMTALTKQFESNFYTTYKDTVHWVKGLSERLDSLEN